MRQPNGYRRVYFAPMEQADISQVAEIDRLSFPVPWGSTSYEYELTENQAAHFIVAVDPSGEPWRPKWLSWLMGRRPARTVIGYAGFWLVVDEAHIGAIAIHPDRRGQGWGGRLLVALLQRAVERGAASATLEVRASNHAAQWLYRKYGFEDVGRRKEYYRDNKEDALLMTVRLDEAYRQRIRTEYLALQEQDLA